MSVRPPKPPRCARLVLEMATELAPLEKLVWMKLDALNAKGEGAYAGAESLGELVGAGKRNVERIRQRLEAAGLLRRQGTGRNGARWFATFPAVASPTGCKAGRAEHTCRHSLAERRALREALDGFIRINREDTRTNATLRTPATELSTQFLRMSEGDSVAKRTKPSAESHARPSLEVVEAVVGRNKSHFNSGQERVHWRSTMAEVGMAIAQQGPQHIRELLEASGSGGR